MIVIGHEAVCNKIHSRRLEIGIQSPQKVVIVFILQKYSLLVVAAVVNVIEVSWLKIHKTCKKSDFYERIHM